jgi:hypothetical protein
MVNGGFSVWTPWHVYAFSSLFWRSSAKQASRETLGIIKRAAFTSVLPILHFMATSLGRNIRCFSLHDGAEQNECQPLTLDINYIYR